jgi:hypothetical protein
MCAYDRDGFTFRSRVPNNAEVQEFMKVALIIFEYPNIRELTPIPVDIAVKGHDGWFRSSGPKSLSYTRLIFVDFSESLETIHLMIFTLLMKHFPERLSYETNLNNFKELF